MSTEELRELDVFCAEHILKLRRVKSLLEIVEGTFAVHEGEGVVYIHVNYNHIERFCPTSGGNDMIQVLEKCATLVVGPVRIWRLGQDRWMLEDSPEGERGAKAPTLPLAICRFARQLFSERGGE